MYSTSCQGIHKHYFFHVATIHYFCSGIFIQYIYMYVFRVQTQLFFKLLYVVTKYFVEKNNKLCNDCIAIYVVNID
jgi:hypothetical protein